MKQPQKQVKDLTETELKALAYDQIAFVEQAQNNLKLINQELSLRNQPPVEEKVEAQPKKK